MFNCYVVYINSRPYAIVQSEIDALILIRQLKNETNKNNYRAEPRFIKDIGF